MSLGRIDALAGAERAHGLVRWAEVAGGDVEGMVRGGVIERVGPGVYRVRGAPRTWEQSLLLGVWMRGGGAAASHRAAAQLHRLPGFRADIVEITQPRIAGRPKERSGSVHTALLLPDRHLTQRSAIPVTTVARTIFDLARRQPRGRMEVLLDHVLSRKLATLAEVRRVFFELAGRGRGGTALMRELLEARSDAVVAPASELEAHARRVFRTHGVPEPRFEVDLGDEDWIGRVDCVFDDARLVVEIDGAPYHEGLTNRTRDRWRDIRLAAAGWRVQRYIGEDFRQRPAEVVAAVLRALATSAVPPKRNLST